MWHKMHKCNDAHFELTATEAVKMKKKVETRSKVGRFERRPMLHH